MSGAVDDFCGLEKQLDHPVINETGRQGTFSFDVTSSVGVDKDFFTRVRDQLDLVIHGAEALEGTSRSSSLIAVGPPQ